jgi:hypothetical protein
MERLRLLAANRARAARVRIRQGVTGRGRSPRVSSYPFISGDTFRNNSDFILDLNTDENDFVESIDRVIDSPSTLFCDVDRLEDLRRISNQVDLSRFSVIVHNGDVINEATIQHLSNRCLRVFSVNWLGSRSIAEPIPIGLENASWNHNGIMADFLHYHPAHLKTHITRDREFNCLLAYSTQTNVKEREHVASHFRGAQKTEIFFGRISRRKYIQRIESSYFVVSPPGNGPDCHRTWEAMYAGAIPIVLSRAWPFHHLKLPVLIVEDWETARELMSGDPKKLYKSIWLEADWRQMYFSNFEKLIWN